MRIKLYVNRFFSILLLAATLCSTQNLFAGNPLSGTPKKGKKSSSSGIKPEIGISTGALSFMGDAGYFDLKDPFVYKYSYALDAEFLYKYNIVFAGNFLAGQMVGNRKSLLQNVNFETTVYAPSVNARYYLLKSDGSKRLVTPFVSVGVAGIIFNTNTDLVDKNGRTYHFWKDGTIKDKSETDVDKYKATLIHRDYKYETKAKSGFALGFPVGVGIKMKITSHLSASLSATYNYSMSDDLDNVTTVPAGVAESVGPDKFIYPAFSLHYDFAGRSSGGNSKKSNSENYKDVDFLAIEYVDGDGDGVTDFKDRCPGTPRDIKVNEFGCPLDDDNDGIANYLDKEKNTRPGVPVDELGIEVTDNYLIRKMQEDSVKFRGDTVYLKVSNERTIERAAETPAVVETPVVTETPVKSEEAIPVETPAPAVETPSAEPVIPPTPVQPENTTAITPPVVPAETPATPPAVVKTDAFEINISSKKPFILSGLNFKPQSYDLSAESKSYLDKVAANMKSNPSKKYEIGGHTDNSGSKGLNQRLSYDRAKAVYFYLISKGVSKSRLSYEGYGSTFPIAPNTNAENKAKNRRIELKLVK